MVQGFTAAADRHDLSSSVHPREAAPAAARRVAEQPLRERPALTGVVVHNEPVLKPLIDASNNSAWAFRATSPSRQSAPTNWRRAPASRSPRSLSRPRR
ncbi:hypothetical protein AQJ43_25000 [Streptomyces avermitilis]|uniref:Uncharacterized protein n=2 Tax=Streptomyces avermitilis TaxID=33903 RepID=Q82D75_STRAW|nr:hypothetical protein AQJ43_25000 [Streptomyces avermitilis]BAC72821.1 hypothetical protein SAVERM_5109 [Streptomyces avermitilis MA-4680 = NBRC 14893]BBJ53213.1 hypothetical protein SAVMC3_58420 [Streptomyces avermitilis]GDY65224.1 hypothetical protein SAV14893_046170 [Streptomyces avermitilis]GDY74561.1 hypothetical protein SAV31267_040460 [Streptomyces avermitilis]